METWHDLHILLYFKKKKITAAGVMEIPLCIAEWPWKNKNKNIYNWADAVWNYLCSPKLDFNIIQKNACKKKFQLTFNF